MWTCWPMVFEIFFNNSNLFNIYVYIRCPGRFTLLYSIFTLLFSWSVRMKVKQRKLCYIFRNSHLWPLTNDILWSHDLSKLNIFGIKNLAWSTKFPYFPTLRIFSSSQSMWIIPVNGGKIFVLLVIFCQFNLKPVFPCPILCFACYSQVSQCACIYKHFWTINLRVQ